jgi:hypothetical protein
MNRGWTIMSGTWNFLKNHSSRQADLTTHIQEEVNRQREAENAGYRSPTWATLRCLQKLGKATCVNGGTAITLPPFFDSARRGNKKLWGNGSGPTVYLWETLTKQERQECLEKIQTTNNWLVWLEASSALDEETIHFAGDRVG